MSQNKFQTSCIIDFSKYLGRIEGISTDLNKDIIKINVDIFQYLMISLII